MRHGRRHLLVHAHLFLDRPFHTHQTDAELVLKKFADGAHPAVAEVIDIVNLSNILAQLEQVTDGGVEILGLHGAVLGAAGIVFFVQLDIELQPANAREIVLARIEEHAVEQGGRSVQRRRIAGTQFAVDLDQRFLRRLHRVALQGLADHRTHVVALREEHVQFNHGGLEDLRQFVGGELGVGFEQDFPGGGVDYIARHPCAFEVRDVDFNLADLRLQDLFQNRGVDLAAGVRDLVPGLVLDAVRQLHAQQVGGLFDRRIKRPEQLLVADDQPVDGIEGAQNVFARTQAQGAQENRAQELALAVNADIQNVLLVVLELHPRSAVRNDLAEEVGAVVGGLKEHARRTVQLADDHALGAVHNEGAVLRHQRHVAEEHFLLLDVADGTVAGLRVLVEDGQPHGDLERSGIGHAALFALGHVILQLQSHRVAALVAEVRGVGVVGAALVAEHIAGMERIGDDRRSAILTRWYAGDVDLLGVRTCTPSCRWRNPRTPAARRCGSR